MGQNLVLNMADHGFTVTVYNRTTETMTRFVNGPASDKSVVGAESIEELVASLTQPRRVMLMVKAGPAVDAVIESLLPLLDEGDIVIDGGNSEFTDTIRRTRDVEDRGFRFIGTGVSGGEEGARNGPSIMPGGTEAAWPLVKDILQSIAAKVADGTPCCDWVGSDGAGHYVKMVHNGIEYGDMQVIAEAYDLMFRGLGMDHDEMHDVFAEWNRGKLDSYLIEITRDIMAFRDEDGSPLVESILDAAGQKGTGKWTVISSMELGQPVTLVAEAVYGRVVSALKEQRKAASAVVTGPAPQIEGDRAAVLSDLHDALYASKITSYAQGFMLLAAAADDHDWALDYASIASMWRGGCIIRSRFLNEVMRAYREQPDLTNLLLDSFFSDELAAAQPGWPWWARLPTTA